MERPRASNPNPTAEFNSCLPFKMIPMHIDIIQNIVNGKTEKDLAEQVGLSVNTLGTHRQDIGWLGIPENERTEPVPASLIIPALIQDGLNQGYLSPPNLPENPVKIHNYEDAIIKAICDGESALAIFQKHSGTTGIKYEQVRNIIKGIRAKFSADNNYHLIALYTACKNSGLVEYI